MKVQRAILKKSSFDVGMGVWLASQLKVLRQSFLCYRQGTVRGELSCTGIGLVVLSVTSSSETISIFHGCMVWIEKSVTRGTDRHHEACLVMPNSDTE